MGMFDKDKLYGGTPLEQWIQPDTNFILYHAEIETEEFPLDDGSKATKCALFVARTETPNDVQKVSTLSGVTADKVRDAEPDDFPAICQFQTVPAGTPGWNDAKVLRFVRAGDPDSVPEFNKDDVRDGDTLSGQAATGTVAE